MRVHVAYEPYVRCPKFLDCPENFEVMITHVFLQNKEHNFLELVLKPTLPKQHCSAYSSHALWTEIASTVHGYHDINLAFYKLNVFRLLCWQCKQKGFEGNKILNLHSCYPLVLTALWSYNLLYNIITCFYTSFSILCPVTSFIFWKHFYNFIIIKSNDWFSHI